MPPASINNRMKPFKISPKRQKELDVVNYFQLPRACYTVSANCRTITAAMIHEDQNGDTPEAAYFAITDTGAKEVVTIDATRLYQLLDAKRRRHRLMEMYEDGVEEGSTPYATLLDEAPRPVAEYMSREMFKGGDKALIMATYEELTASSG